MTLDAFNIPEGYIPSDSEEYMGPLQLQYFGMLLLKMKNDLLSASGHEPIVAANANYDADMSDNAFSDAESYTEYCTRDIQYNNLMNINDRLSSIKNGDYGYCKVSGKKIGLRRLMANPTATLCIEEQEKYEKIKNGYASSGDDENMM